MKSTLYGVYEERYVLICRIHIESAMMTTVGVGYREMYWDISIPGHVVAGLA